MYSLRLLCVSVILVACLPTQQLRADEDPWALPIERRLPPMGQPLPGPTVAMLETRLAGLQQRLNDRENGYLKDDVAVLLKAVKFALIHNEFYKPGDDKKAVALLDEAERRLKLLAADQPDWATQRGLVVRGFSSKIDGSPQPYGVEIPEQLNLSKPQPLIVWLHGRGDTNTDMHFIYERMKKPGQVAPPWAMVLHPFGRQCVGYKSAGETDVLEAIEHVKQHYQVDERRIVLMGFSMGGAGAWHLGAHYADKWAAVSPGAGFADTARYQRLTPENYPPIYEQKLWGIYDVPAYVRNLFNVPVVAYSGEEDKQIQAAQLMEEAFEQEGEKLTHLIGPGMGHKYHPEVLAEILKRMKAAAVAGRPEFPREVHLQTRTLRYNQMYWVEALKLEEHWLDSRIDAKIVGGDTVEVTTTNVSVFRINPTDAAQLKQLKWIVIDGQRSPIRLDLPAGLIFARHEGSWHAAGGISNPFSPKYTPPELVKRHGLQGPIDDAFREPFLFVLPRGEFANPQVKRWVSREAAHQLVRWAALMRGTARVKHVTDVTAEDIASYNLVLWGDPSSNGLIREFVASPHQPLQWDNKQFTLAGNTYAADAHLPVMIYPNPANPRRYVLLNSGIAFRVAHDRTNSLQNPKLPDWAVLNITEPPTAEAAGKVIAADFFDETWQVK